MPDESTARIDSIRCQNRDKPIPLPPSFTIEAARTHPRYASMLEPGARCELTEGHEGAHRNGQLLWHDPPRLMVGGAPFVPPAGEWPPALEAP